MNRRRAAAAAAALVFYLLLPDLTVLRRVAAASREIKMEHYAFIGEILMHGIRERAHVVSYRMPLATTTSALVQYHAGLPARVVMALYLAAIVALCVCLGSLLHPYGAFFALAGAMVVVQSADLTLKPESGYLLLLLLTACLLCWRARAPSLGRSALLALAVGATLLYRTPLIFFPPVLALYEWAVFHRFSLRAYWRHAVILCLAPYLFLLPWIGLNWTVHRQLIYAEKDAASSNIMTGALGLVRSIEGDLDTLSDEPLDTGRSGAVLRWAARQVAAHPLRYALGVARRAWFALSFDTTMLILAALSALAVWIFRRRREFQLLALLTAYYFAVHCLMSVESVYFEPLWPLFSTLAVAPIGGLAARDLPAVDSKAYRLSVFAVKSALAAAVLLSAHAAWVVGSYALRAGAPRSEIAGDYDRALASHPTDAWLLTARGEERLARGELAGAERDLTGALAAEPGNARTELRLAWARALRDEPEILLSWSPPARASGDDASQLRLDAEIFKSCHFVRTRQPGKAEAALKTAMSAYEERNTVVRGSHGVPEKAVYERLRSSDSGFTVHCSGLQGNRPLAERLALNDALLKLLPESSPAWLARAELEAEAGRRGSSLAALARAEGHKPNAATRARIVALHVRLRADLRAKRLEQAEVAARAGRRAAARKAALEIEALGPTEDERRRLDRLRSAH